MAKAQDKTLPAGLRSYWSRLTSLGRHENPKVLFEGDSPLHHVIVSEHDGIRTMHLGHEAYEAETSIRIDDPEAPIFEYPGMMMVGLALAPGREILMLGLGGGYVPSLFRRRLPDRRLTVVEIDPLVAELAETWFGFRPGGNVSLVVKDGLDHVAGSPDGAYDQIWLDAFGGDYIPPHLADVSFLELCREKIRDGGLLIQNLHQSARNYPAQLRHTAELFGVEPLLFGGIRSGNTVAMSFNVAEPAPLLDSNDLLAAVKAFQPKVGPYDLVEELRKVFHEPGILPPTRPGPR
jgi:spermidine synthase